MGIPTCLGCKTAWGHTLDCPVVLGWRERAEKAEAEVERLRAALEYIESGWPDSRHAAAEALAGRDPRPTFAPSHPAGKVDP